MSPKEIVILVAFIVCVLGVIVGAILGLAGIWVENFGKIGARLFFTDLVITLACLIIAGLTAAFWK